MNQPLNILYEDNHIIAVNKRAGDLVQGDITGDTPLADYVKSYLKEKYKKPGEVFLGVVHRLDRPVSGVVLFARTSKALTRLTGFFREKEVSKTYWALVKKRPVPEQGKLVHYLKKNKVNNKVTAFRIEKRNTKRAELNYVLKSQHGKVLLIEVNPLTGRPHQIRVQLSAIGCPIIGDVKYGFGDPNGDGSICLHATSIEFEHPVKKERILINAEAPENKFWNTLQ